VEQLQKVGLRSALHVSSVLVAQVVTVAQVALMALVAQQVVFQILDLLQQVAVAAETLLPTQQAVLVERRELLTEFLLFLGMVAQVVLVH
jgi:hypothetical protein